MRSVFLWRKLAIVIEMLRDKQKISWLQFTENYGAAHCWRGLLNINLLSLWLILSGFLLGN
jgi:hypothetical protein